MGTRIQLSLCVGLVDQPLEIIESLRERALNTRIVLPSLDEANRSTELRGVRNLLNRFADDLLDYDPTTRKMGAASFSFLELNNSTRCAGIVVNSEYASEIAYALATLDARYLVDGYSIMPSVSPEEESALPAFLKHRHGSLPDNLRYDVVNDAEMLRSEGHLYLWFSAEIEEWIEAAGHIFNLLGLNIAAKDLRLFLHWSWV